ncbi:hypothetical protein CP532_3888 [Ophiocordyceps camponoti-leonardi (nom. inval.)]|nr:hypothetical protein CP532_3888 [Ophiocordyceps camponoti-leonardi (nom. inval.)]
MSLLSAHLEQISYSCQGIDSLRFPPPKIFTNALLSNHDITSLIRDTEAHERALFSVPAPATQQQQQQDAPPTSAVQPPPRGGEDEAADVNRRRRQTVFSVASGEVTAAPTGSASHPRRRTAVAAVLGGEMHEQLRNADRKGELDVEVLLRGAEKLCGVYELPGARERIASLRSRFRAGSNTIAYYEAKVADQTAQLAAMNKLWIDDVDADSKQPEDETEAWTEDDLRREEQEAREMEAKKKELQERLRAMDKDIGGLMNM